MINYYEYDTSPRKLKPEYEENINEIQKINKTTKTKVKSKKPAKLFTQLHSFAGFYSDKISKKESGNSSEPFSRTTESDHRRFRNVSVISSGNGF